MVGGDRAFVAELVDNYLADGPSSLGRDARGPRSRRGRGPAPRPAHTLKSSSARWAPRLAAACRDVEAARSRGELGGARTGRRARDRADAVVAAPRRAGRGAAA